MSIAISPQAILDKVAFRMHLPDFASGEFVTDAQALTLLQDACERLSGLLLEVFGAPHFSKQFTVATQAGVDVVSLPSGLARIEAVWWLAPRGSDTIEIRMEPAYTVDSDLTPRAWDRNLNLYREPWYGQPPSYRVEGNALVLRPVPSEVYSLRVDYQDTPTIAALSDTIYGQAGWAEWMVLDVCEQISDREDKDPTRWTLRKQKIEADLRDQASNRDRGQRVQATNLRTPQLRRGWRWQR